LKGILGEDPGTLREILADFKVSTQRLPADLRAAAALQDTRRIATIAHGLKSASRSTGSSTLGDCCAELENACGTGIQDAISKAVSELEVAPLNAHAEIGELLRE
jgi:two-component system sensor histidine kinase/response regulator